MSSPVKILPHYKYEDWVRGEGQWELIDGIPYAMSPAPVPKHQRLGGNLFTEFRLALKGCNNSCAVYQPIDFKINEDTILQPDMPVVCGEIEKKYLDFAPSLVAEILSPATALKDRHAKFEIYQAEKIPYFLIINSEEEIIEVYVLSKDEYELRLKGREIQFEFQFTGCSVLLDFKEIWD